LSRVKVSVIQTGPSSTNKETNLQSALKLCERIANTEPDFVVFPELFLTPYFCTRSGVNPENLGYSESTEGASVRAFSKVAREYGCYVILPFLERAADALYYNSATLLGPDGGLVKGTLPDGSTVASYRKNHLSNYWSENLVLDEYPYMKPGRGFPIFETRLTKVGILICKDSIFPESWRVLALQGAQVIFVPSSSPNVFSGTWVCGLSASALANQLFGVACNRAGTEEGTMYFGLSCVVGPDGHVIAKAAEGRPDAVTAALDLDEIPRQKKAQDVFRDRRPDLYGPILRETNQKQNQDQLAPPGE